VEALTCPEAAQAIPEGCGQPASAAVGATTAMLLSY